MKRTIKNTCVFMCMILIISIFSPTFSAEQKDVTSLGISIKDKKIYANATIEQEFVDNQILVIMDRSVSAINKTHEFSVVRSVDIINVTDLTQIDVPQLELEANSFSLRNEEFDLEYVAPLINTESFRQILLLELPIHSKANVLEVIKKLESVEGIMYAGPNYITYPTTTIPSDSYSGSQWAIEKIQLDEAWDVTTGSTTVRVGIIDSGIAFHSDLNANVVEGYDFANDNSTTTDDVSGHGTHVAGTIAAVGNNGQGIVGTSWNIKLVPLQVTMSNGFQADLAHVVEAISYAINHNIQILNYSRGTKTYYEPLKQAIANYQGLFVCAAGNGSDNIDSSPYYATSYGFRNIISVANSTPTDQLDSTSNFGAETVHLAAPGTSILSCFPSSICDEGCTAAEYGVHYQNGYHYMTGTSMAAPHVAGVAALIKSIRPNLSALEIKELILDNVDKLTSLQDKCITGGRLNAYKAVLAATEPETFTGDVNGDGRADVILSRGVNGKRAITTFLGQSDGRFSEPITTQMTNNFIYCDPAFVGDFNGDGLTDVLIHWVNGGYRRLLVYTSRGDGTYNTGVNVLSTRFHDANQLPCSFHVADVNGDGKDDFIVHYRNLNGNRSALVYKGKSGAPYLDDATTDALTSTNEYRPQDPVFVGDFNGDGYADMLVHWVNSSDKRQLLVYTGKSDGTFNSGANLSSSRYHKPETYPTKFFVTDVNGDGKDDFVVHWQNSDGKRCNLVYKGKSSSPYFSDATSDAIVSSNNYVETDPVYVGDINGDGRSDMVVHWANGSMYRQFLIYTANSNGTYNVATRISTSEVHNRNIYATMFIADVNGDGCDDFVVKRKRTNDGVQFLIYLGATDGTLSEALYSVPTTFIPYFDALPT